MTLPLVLFCLAIVGSSLLGGGLPLATVLTHTRLQIYLSLAAGVMLGATFFHMLPEAVEIGSPEILPWTALGLLALFFLERFFSFHHHESPGEPSIQGDSGQEFSADHHHPAGLIDPHAPTGLDASTKGSALHWGAATFGLTVHSLTGGIALASAVVTDYTTRGGIGAASWGVFLATVIHKPADALTIVSLMLRAGVSRRLAHMINLGFSLMIPGGVAIFLIGLGVLDPTRAVTVTAAALAFSAGTFLCIALSDLLPELQFHSHDRVKLSLALLIGFGVMALAGFGEHQHQENDGHGHAHDIGDGTDDDRPLVLPTDGD